MPTDAPRPGLRYSIQRREREVLHALGIDMDFAAVISRKPLDKFRDDALGSMLPVEEWRNDDELHVTTSERCTQFRLGPLVWAVAAAERKVFQRGAKSNLSKRTYDRQTNYHGESG